MRRTSWQTLIAITTVLVVQQDLHLRARLFQPQFGTTTTLVTVPVRVAHKSSVAGPATPDLMKADFRVFEDGVEQEIAAIDHQRRPVSVCIVLDASYSMSGLQDIGRASADAVINRLLPDDQVMVMQFAQTVRFLLPWTDGLAQARIAWSNYTLRPETRLIDAVSTAMAELTSARNQIRVVLVVSDGKDLHSSISPHVLASTRRASEALIYAFHADPAGRQFVGTVRPDNYLPLVVGDSGGLVYSVFDARRAQAAAATLLDELRSLYLIGYHTSRPLDGKYRRLKVQTKNPDLRVRHRAGYIAAALEQ